MENNISADSFFISFEGIEGSGKTTQINKLKTKLASEGYEVLTLREPGGTDFGEKLRSAILESTEEINPLSEALLFASSRAQLLAKKVLPYLEQPKRVVILDRYIDSSFAYQGMARGLGIETIETLHSSYPLNIMPQMSLYLKIDLETSLKRQESRGNAKDYFEREKEDFYKLLIKGFELCSQKFSNRIKVIDATKSEEEVFKSVHEQIKELIKNG